MSPGHLGLNIKEHVFCLEGKDAASCGELSVCIRKTLYCMVPAKHAALYKSVQMHVNYWEETGVSIEPAVHPKAGYVQQV